MLLYQGLELIHFVTFMNRYTGQSSFSLVMQGSSSPWCCYYEYVSCVGHIGLGVWCWLSMLKSWFRNWLDPVFFTACVLSPRNVHDNPIRDNIEILNLILDSRHLCQVDKVGQRPNIKRQSYSNSTTCRSMMEEELSLAYLQHYCSLNCSMKNENNNII